MENTQQPAVPGARVRTEVTCGRCGATATVPFVPTPGRPVYCRPCFDRRPAPTQRARPGSYRPGGPQVRAPPPQRMLSMRRKGHFVHDAMAALDAEADLEDQQRRAFVEMLFARGSRQTAEAALEFLEEKREEGVVSDTEAERLAGLVDRYTVQR